MLVRRYLVKFKEFPIDKASVKAGKTSTEVVTACRCVNIGLFVSGDLRRDVIVSLAVGSESDLKVVSFPGDSLKRVSPDERSVSFFLLKAMDRIENLEPRESFTMDNGIQLERTSLDELVEQMGSGLIHVPSTGPERFILDANLYADRMENTP